MLDLVIVTDIARSSPLIMKDGVDTAIDEDLWTHLDYDWDTNPGLERNNLQTLDPKPIVRRRELMKILHVILSDKPDPVLTYHTQRIYESSLEQRHVLKPDNMASTRAYQRLDEGDVWGRILNPRAPIHEDISQAGMEEDDDVIMCDEVDLVSRRVEAVARDEEGRESEIEREQEEQVRAAQHAHKKQRTASPDHRTDSATRDTKGSNRKHKHDAEQHSEEKTEKGKHRKSRRDDFRSDKDCDTRPSTSKDFNQRPYSPAKKVYEDDLLLKKDGLIPSCTPNRMALKAGRRSAPHHICPQSMRLRCQTLLRPAANGSL
ncbi:MAG: hypothetical protein GY696_25995 [Gammaproteobacteria bacterium]|nr:hypothetical protein [Gammaproteobacteria bacterium]